MLTSRTTDRRRCGDDRPLVDATTLLASSLEQVVPGVRRRRVTAGVEPDHGASRQRHGHPQRCRHVERELSSQRVVSTYHLREHVAKLVPCYRRPVCDCINNASSSLIQRRIYYTISVQPKKDKTRFEVENYDHIN